MASNRTLDQISIIRKKEDHSMAHIADTTFKSWNHFSPGKSFLQNIYKKINK